MHGPSRSTCSTGTACSVAWLAPVLYVAHTIYRKRSTFAFQVAREGFTRVSTNLAENITGIPAATSGSPQRSPPSARSSRATR